ncbi:hypothetical protein [Streptomyces goshikiensis]|uniref:hypothetical protein n=1 Tax=Streptomyces goshikiensis TaxID=1942 RepID=UPI0036763365
MDDNPTGPQFPGPSPASPSAGRPGPYEQGSPLAAFMGREFAVALREGLARATAHALRPTTGPRRPAPAPRTAVAPGIALLSEYAEAILDRFEKAMPLEPALAGPSLRGVRIALLWWARQVFAAARPPDGPGEAVASGQEVPRLPASAPDRQTAAVSLLIESASLCLPSDAPAGPEAIRALARMVRITGEARPGRVRSAASAEGGIPGAGPGRRRARAAG